MQYLCSVVADDQAHFQSLLDNLLKPPQLKYYTPRSRSPTVIPSTAPIPSSTKGYAPFSPLPLLRRLQTYGHIYIPKPLSARSLALAGWVASGGAFKCDTCGKVWGLGQLDTVKNEAIRRDVLLKLSRNLRSYHSSSCGWRYVSTPPETIRELRSLLNPTLSSSLAPLRQALQSRVLSNPTLDAVRWVSPLLPEELDNLTLNLDRYAQLHLRFPDQENEPAQPSDKDLFASALAFFGWYPLDVAGPDATCVQPGGAGSRTEIVRCRMCLRRIGLWKHVQDDSSMDVLESHLGWCPIRGDWYAGSPSLQPPGTKTPKRILNEISISERPKKKWRR